MESSILSVNRDYYGDLHNMGHVFISYAHDPDHRNLESFGVIGDSATAMRDPAFYRWHAYVDDLFQQHKERLTPYTVPELTFQGIQVTNIQVQPSSGPANTFQTYWQQSDVDFSRGMDFVPRGNVFARFTHLQHTDFQWAVNITNNTGAQTNGMVRIFLAPRFDERGTQMLLRDQRLMMTEMDKFPAACEFSTSTKARSRFLFYFERNLCSEPRRQPDPPPLDGIQRDDSIRENVPQLGRESPWRRHHPGV